MTTNVVVAEAHALLLRRAGLQAASAFLTAVRAAPTEIEYITPEREEAAIGNWIERFSDQPFSLADAASFVVMTELGIQEALTLDHHFRVAGFIMLPARRRSPPKLTARAPTPDSRRRPAESLPTLLRIVRPAGSDTA